MPLTEAELLDIQADTMADDVLIDLELMSCWSLDDATKHFESGGAWVPPAPTVSFTAPFTKGSQPTGTTPWLACLEKKAGAKYRLVVFSWTGNRGGQGSAHNLRRAPCNWSAEAGAACEVYEVPLPGRGTRMKDQRFTSTEALVKDCAKALADALNDGLPYAFVGFSFGAIIAWEVAIAIAAATPGQGPAFLCPVSAEGPAWTGRAGKLHASGEPEFKKVLKDKGGTDFILRDEGMSKMYLPVIRDDLALEETYTCQTGHIAAVPTTAVHGTKPGRDKETTKIAAQDAQLWVSATSAAASKVVSLEQCDWYVLQDEAGVKAVLSEVNGFMQSL